jgi:hypothetical protein
LPRAIDFPPESANRSPVPLAGQQLQLQHVPDRSPFPPAQRDTVPSPVPPAAKYDPAAENHIPPALVVSVPSSPLLFLPFYAASYFFVSVVAATGFFLENGQNKTTIALHFSAISGRIVGHEHFSPAKEDHLCWN